MKRALAAAAILGLILWWFLREPPGDPRLPPQVRREVVRLQSGSDDSRLKAIQELLKEPPSPALALALAPSITDPAVSGMVAQWFRYNVKVSGDAVPILVAALDHDNGAVRLEALRALSEFGERAAPAVPALIRMLERKKERRLALSVLDDVGPAALPAVDAIVAHASGPDCWFCLLPMDEPWFPLERALPVLLERVTDPDRSVARVATWATLKRLASAPEDCGAPPALIRAARSTSIPEVEGLLDDEDPRVRVCAAEVLGDLVQKTGREISLEPLIRALKHRRPDVRLEAADQLSMLDSKNLGAAVPALGEALLDADMQVGPMAAFALGSLGAEAAPALAHAIETRLHMVEPGFAALGRMGPAATGALIGLLRSESLVVRTTAGELLGRALFDSGRAEMPPLTADLVGALQNEEFVLKALTRGVLEQWGKDARPAVRALTAIAVGTGYGGDRVKALRLLESFGPDSAEAVPSLTAVLERNETPLVEEFMRVLGAVGPAAGEAVPTLTKFAETNPYPTFRIGALAALGRIGAPDVLKRALADPEPFVRLAAAAGLPEEDGLPTLVRLLEHPDYLVRRAVIGLARPALRPGILRRLASKGPDERAESLKALVAMGATTDLPRVAECLGDADETVRKEAIKAVEALSPDADHAARLLQRVLEDLEGIRALARLAPRSPEAVRLLRQATMLKPSLARREAAEHLGELRAKEAFPELLWLLKQGGSYDQSAALAAIGKIGPAGAAVVGAIVARFAADGSTEASAIIMAFTPEARDAVPLLIPLLSNRNPWHREVAARGLAGIGPASRPALPALARAVLECENDPQREALFSALNAIGAEAAPELRKLIPQARPFVRYDAVALLARFEPESGEWLNLLQEVVRNGERYAVRALRWAPAATAVPMLIEALRDAGPGVAREAVETLGTFGPDARDAVGPLRKLLPHDGASEALRKIESP